VRGDVALVDTSVWVDHLRGTSSGLAERLVDGTVLVHPFVIGELSCGSLRHRAQVLDLLARLPEAPVLSHTEALAFVETRRLWSRGLGWVDVHLLGSALLARARLVTTDRRMRAIAAELGIAG